MTRVLKTFLEDSDLLRCKRTSKTNLLCAIGVDPAICNTGVSLLFIENSEYHIVDAHKISTNPLKLDSERLKLLYDELLSILTQWKNAVYLHNKSDRKTYRNIEFSKVGLEVPAVHLGGKQRFNTDMKQRESIAICKLAIVNAGFEIYGESDGSLIRPISIHKLVGSNIKGLSRDEKKSLSVDYMRNCHVNLAISDFSHDVADSVAAAVIAGINNK